MTQEAKVINIDGKDYKEDELSEEQVKLINHIQDLSLQEKQILMKYEQIQTAKDSFFARLKNSLTEETKDDG